MTKKIPQLILLTNNNEILHKFFNYYFNSFNVITYNGKFHDIMDFGDCVVAPGNSFGLMDAGFDKAIIDYFGEELKERVKNYIKIHFFGEQPVGSSFILRILSDNNNNYKFLAHSPTMRIPMKIKHTDYVYLAMRATLIEIMKYNYYMKKDYIGEIKKIIIPAFGTGYGGVPYKECIRQMFLAYKNIIDIPDNITWPMAHDKQSEIIFGGDFGLEIDPEE